MWYIMNDSLKAIEKKQNRMLKQKSNRGMEKLDGIRI